MKFLNSHDVVVEELAATDPGLALIHPGEEGGRILGPPDGELAGVVVVVVLQLGAVPAKLTVYRGGTIQDFSVSSHSSRVGVPTRDSQVRAKARDIGD